MKVLLVDPWGINNTSEYLNGLIMGLSKKVELVVFTNSLFELKVESSAEIHKVFFPKSENMKHGKMRSLLRGVEYIIGYEKLIRYVKSNPDIEIIHFNWLLSYGIDIKYLKKLKDMGKKVVYTAHNVIPHYNLTEQKKEHLKTIYSLCDKIVLHGITVGEEFQKLFPEYYFKVYFQKHGCNLDPNLTIDLATISTEIIQKIGNFRRLYLYFGKIFYNKGVDRLIKLWNPNWTSSLLVIAGRTEEAYRELDEQLKKASECDNIIFLNEYVDDNTLNYLISRSNLILLPYRHASMSGVVFTAADFGKPLLCTDAGAIGEYLENGIDSFVVNNNDQLLSEKIRLIEDEYSNEDLNNMGLQLQQNIKEKCDWAKVAERLVHDCYMSID